MSLRGLLFACLLSNCYYAVAYSHCAPPYFATIRQFRQHFGVQVLKVEAFAA